VAVPPIRFWLAWLLIVTPDWVFPRSAAPAVSEPIAFPCTSVLVVVAPAMKIPLPLLPKMNCCK
jgi:hypothetical protein